MTRIDLDRSVKIGLLLPLSGRHARLGGAMLNAAQLALFDIADDRFSLVVRDTGGTPDGARAAAQAVLAEGVWLILGPLFSTSAEAMLAEAQAAQINTLTFSNDRSVAGNGVFVMGLAPYPQIHRLIAYARQQGLNRFAVLAPDTRYGQAVIQAVHDAIFRNSAELSRIVSYKPDSGDVSAEVRRLADYDLRRRALQEQRQVLLSRGDEAAQLA
ncbi:MAG: penicillin-binding protein activator, partial [Kiloniellales bacterium]